MNRYLIKTSHTQFEIEAEWLEIEGNRVSFITNQEKVAYFWDCAYSQFPEIIKGWLR